MAVQSLLEKLLFPEALLLAPPLLCRQGVVVSGAHAETLMGDTQVVLVLKGLRTGVEDSHVKLYTVNSVQTRQEKQKEDREEKTHGHTPLPPALPPPPETPLHTQTTDLGIVESGTETAAEKENISSYAEPCPGWAWAPAHNACGGEEGGVLSKRTPASFAFLPGLCWPGLVSNQFPLLQVETDKTNREGVMGGRKPFF